MKPNQLLGVIGGVLLLISLFVPEHGMMMIKWVQLISLSFKMGLFPIIVLVAGAAGAYLAWKNNAVGALACGAIALLYMLIISEFNFSGIFKSIPALLLLIGSVLLIAGGAMGMKKAE